MQFEGLEKNEHQECRSSIEIATSAVEFSILPEAVLCSDHPEQAAVCMLTTCNKDCFANLLAATTQPGHVTHVHYSL